MTNYQIIITFVTIFFSCIALYLTILKIIKQEVKKEVAENHSAR